VEAGKGSVNRKRASWPCLNSAWSCRGSHRNIM
jgi:hypothetical protein